MKKIALVISTFAACALSWAAGFQVLEQGASNVGTALAGATVNANNDASAAFWNPSAAFFVEGNRIDSAMNLIIPSFSLKDYSGTKPYTGAPINDAYHGGNAGKLAFIPNLYTVYKLSEDWLVTFSMTAPYGLETNYEDGYRFVGRYHGVKSALETIDLNPSVAYKILDNWTVSAGASAQYINATLTSYSYNPFVGQDIYTRLNGHGWGAGFNLGTTFEYMEGGRIGISYRSQVKHTLKGSVNNSRDICADITIPNTLNIGVYQRLWGDLSSFAVMADYAWTTWNQFEYLDIMDDNNPNGDPISRTSEKWRNTSRVSLGFHYYPEWNDKLVFRLGTAWDQTPVSSDEYRTPRIPDSDRIWASIGAGYTYGWLHFDVGYTYIIIDDSTMNNYDDRTKGRVSGVYSGHAHVLSAQIGIRF